KGHATRPQRSPYLRTSAFARTRRSRDPWQAKVFLHHSQVSIQYDVRRERTSTGSAGLLKPQILEADKIAVFSCSERFGLGDGILCPVEVDAAKIRLLGGQSRRGFLGLVENLHLAVGIDLGSRGIDHHRGKEISRFHDSNPSKRVPPQGKRRGTDRIGVLI